MEHDRWSWFAGGVVLGVLIGAGLAGGYYMPKLAEAEAARAEAEAARLETAKAMFRQFLTDPQPIGFQTIPDDPEAAKKDR